MIVGVNKKALYDYFVEERFESGIELKGTEVRSLRMKRIGFSDAFATDHNGEIWLLHLNIPIYPNANKYNHAPDRKRKLLLHKKEIRKLTGKITREGYTLVPLSIYFKHNKYVKIELGLCKGKKQYDKRESEKRKDWNKEKARLLKY